jgi:hypothetical protein
MTTYEKILKMTEKYNQPFIFRGDKLFFGDDEKPATPEMVVVFEGLEEEYNKQKLIETYTNAMENLMDTNAKTKGYDNRYTASARAGVNGSPFQVEGSAFALWMDNCYFLGYKIIDDVQSGKRPLPSVDEFLAELPKLVW